MIKHRCPEWVNSILGTHLEFISRKIKHKDGSTLNNFWIITDDNTFSIFNDKSCPYCKIELKTLINGNSISN